jgi:predicted dehydrogenase
MLQWGLLSTAKINDALLAGIAQVDGARVAAVASRDSERARAYAAEHGIDRAHGSYEELLADRGVDAVYISLPNSMHHQWTVRALDAGKHVLCEKPYSRYPRDVEEAFELAAARGLVLMEAFMYRHNPQTLRVSELVGGGALGRPRLIRSSFRISVGQDDVRMQRGLDGGGLMDVGCYCVNYARLLGGEPERAFAEQVLGGDGVDVVLAGELRFADELIACFDCGLSLPRHDGLEVVGDEASLYLADPWHAREPRIELRRRDGSVEVVAEEPVNSYAREVENFGAAIRRDARPRLGRDDALGQARAIAALYASAEAGQAVNL